VVVDFVMSRRTKELGIRTALGATRGVIVRAALVSGARPVVAGLVSGLFLAAAGAQALTRILSYTPVALHPSDGTVYLASAALVTTIAAMAMIRPIWRAAASDPAKALREE
jgi:ABC-type antimicrobial peptide transport system permease subunit